MPASLGAHDPVLQDTPRFSHLRIRRRTRGSPMRWSTNRMSHSWLTASKNDRMSASKMQLTFVLVIPTRERVQRIVLATPGPEAIREPKEVFFVDRIQHLRRGPLDDLVFQRRDPPAGAAARPPSQCTPPRRQCSVRAPVDPGVQIHDLAIEVLPRRPATSAHPRRARHLRLSAEKGRPSAGRG